MADPTFALLPDETDDQRESHLNALKGELATQSARADNERETDSNRAAAKDRTAAIEAELKRIRPAGKQTR